jgi:hypothetical protein
MKKMRRTAPMEEVGCIIAGGQEAKSEILIRMGIPDKRAS